MPLLVGITENVIHSFDPDTREALCGMPMSRAMTSDEIVAHTSGGGSMCVECMWTHGLECPHCGSMQYDRKLCRCPGMRAAFPDEEAV